MSREYPERFIKARRADLVGINRGRSGRIRGVMIHATRSGRYDNDDGPGTENWGNNPNNGGAFQDAIVGGDGTRILCTNIERDEQPLWCAGWGGDETWNAQDYYLMVEFSQGTIDSRYTFEEIDSGAQLVGRWAKQYGFEIIRIPELWQTGYAPEGLCTHDRSANGRKLGKSDPGPLFPWEEFIRRATAYRDGRDPDAPKEDAMTNLTPAQLEMLASQIVETQAFKDRVDAVMANQVPLLVNAFFTGGFTSARDRTLAAEAIQAIKQA